MRSREGLALAVLCMALTAAAAPPPAAPAMSASAVQAAASAVAADPLLPGKQTAKRLRLKQPDEKKKNKSDNNDARWWMDLLDNLSTGLRVAMWLVGAGLLVAVLLRLRDWLRLRAGGPALAALPPTHVGTLDIRPESLPDDIGAAARALGQRGEQRAALSLLYRGALSRLVHAHGVPIRAASTERECLALSALRLAPASQAFLADLVAGWQAVAYARRELPANALDALCQGFDAQLPVAGRAA
ncbi:DUF4129 domain-containing protein [Roseateles sp. DC23W]|uniref:DUF4129 domain-containing protein n=1 Tax=Pelomonas dachongensis TaxID=3299029 RepID=A0ABW7EP96_9BURK